MRFGPDDLDRAFAGMTRVVAAKGKKVAEFDLKSRDLDRAALEAAVLGPSGNLRAPALRVGTTLYVGFGADAWKAWAR